MSQSSEKVAEVTSAEIADQMRSVEDVMAVMNAYEAKVHNVVSERESSSTNVAHDSEMCVQSQESIRDQNLYNACAAAVSEIKKKDPKSFKILKSIAKKIGASKTAHVIAAIASAPKKAWQGLSRGAKAFVDMICKKVERCKNNRKEKGGNVSHAKREQKKKISLDAPGHTII